MERTILQFCETDLLFFGESVVLSFLSTPSPKFTPARPRSKVWRGHGDPTIISYLLNGVDYLRALIGILRMEHEICLHGEIKKSPKF